MNRLFNVMSALNPAIKHTKCLEFLKRKEVSITLIQVTHLKITDIHRLQNRFYKCVAYSSAANRSKGNAVLFNRKLGLSIASSGKDEVGRLACLYFN